MEEVVVRLRDVPASVWEILLDASVWLLVGFVAAGLVRSLLPERTLNVLLGRRGVGSVLRAAVLGTPLPLCSCGVLPAAAGLRRQGLSRSSTVSFLVATPQNGVDSIAPAYAMLGPVFAVVKVAVGLVTAVAAGLVTLVVADSEGRSSRVGAGTREGEGGCCGAEGAGRGRRSLLSGQRYAFGTMLGDLAPWLVVGVVVAGVIDAVVPPESLAGWGDGVWAMLAVLAVSVPMYICATASLPVAASLIEAGVSPGTALVFLIAGPATNFAGVAVIRREIGTRATWSYLGAVVFTSVMLGIGTDAVVEATGGGLVATKAGAVKVVPGWLAAGSSVVLAGLLGGHLLARGLRRGERAALREVERRGIAARAR